jgi:hypothetical protein
MHRPEFRPTEPHLQVVTEIRNFWVSGLYPSSGLTQKFLVLFTIITTLQKLLVTEIVFSWVKQTEHEVYYLSPSGAEVNNVCSYASISPCLLTAW